MALLNPSRAQLVTGGALLAVFLLFLLSINRERVASPLRFGHRGTSKGLLNHINNSTLGFEKIFAISLPFRTDQHDSIALASAYSNINIDIIDGVTEVNEKVLPPGAAEAGHNKGNMGSWRAHLNALRTVVKNNISTALIMEGDVDWDLRVKDQMQTFAQASKMLLQPLPGSGERFLDPTYPRSQPGQTPTNFVLTEDLVQEPTTSPYGDVNRWDILWLGHCGAELPRPDEHGTPPLARVMILDDETVAEPEHLRKEWGSDDYMLEFEPHTRVVSRGRLNVCSLAYAVTQQGARKLLYELGIKSFPMAFDLMLRHMCDGVEGRPMTTCLSVQPPIFEHHRPVGNNAAMSNINQHEGYNDKPHTENVRWSTRVNFPKLTKGETDWIDSLPDGPWD